MAKVDIKRKIRTVLVGKQEIELLPNETIGKAIKRLQNPQVPPPDMGEGRDGSKAEEGEGKAGEEKNTK